MAALSDPMATLTAWLKSSILPAKARLLPSDADTLDQLGQSKRRVDGEWFWRLANLEPSLEDLNTNRMGFHVELAGVWSVSKDATQASRIAGIVADVARKLETQPLPGGVDLTEIQGLVEMEDRFGITVAALTFRALCHIEEA
jgi:hypothetical protein